MNKKNAQPVFPSLRRCMLIFLIVPLVLAGFLFATTAYSQGDAPAEPDASAVANKEIAVKDVADDQAIQRRIKNILVKSGWFENVSVEVREGIVILSGVTSDAAYKRWAESVAHQTVDVVAVVNRIAIASEGEWDFTPALDVSAQLWRKFVASLPLIALSLLILLITWFVSRTFRRTLDSMFERRIASSMLRSIVARVLALPVVLLGLYLVLAVTGLGRLAATILGGTGILGLVIGIAFRDITENFLASILISIQRPFRLGDHIKVLEFDGFVQAVTTRGTILMSLDGNHVQIPNATIYKQAIINYTANPNMALAFEVGIGYDCSISFAQNIAMKVLREHPAVLAIPEPLVLTELLGASTITMKVIFWVDGTQHSVIKVKSAIMRMIKSAYMSNNISMPDGDREIVFPEGIPVSAPQELRSLAGADLHSQREPDAPASASGDDCVASDSEGALASEAGEINRQATESVLGENETNILR